MDRPLVTAVAVTAAALFMAISVAKAGVITETISIDMQSDGFDGARQFVQLHPPPDAIGGTLLSFFGTFSNQADPQTYDYREFLAVRFGDDTLAQATFLGSMSQSVSLNATLPEGITEFDFVAWTGQDIGSIPVLFNDTSSVAGSMLLTYDPPGAVPEPASLLCLGTVLLGLVGSRRR